jgi:enoyl-CoA hydratase
MHDIEEGATVPRTSDNLDDLTVVELERQGTVALVTLNDPDRLNPTDALTTIAEMNDVLVSLGRDRVTRAVVITGRGRAFSAGANLGTRRPPRYPEDAEDTVAQRLAYGYAYGSMWEVIHNFRKPLIAAVNGYCLGGGWELAHACDMVIAGESAKFGSVEITNGLPPFATTTNYLPKMIGKHRAMELILTGRKITAQEALEYGLVNEVLDDEKTLTRALEIAQDIAARPPIAVAFARSLINRAMSVNENYELERAYGYYASLTEDHQAARLAVAKQQPAPEFHGR